MDKGILKKMIEGDKHSFKLVYEEYMGSLWAYVFSRIKDRELANDIVADSFLLLFEYRKLIKTPEGVKPYLYKVAKNKMIEFYRKPKPVIMTEYDFDRCAVEYEKNTPRTINKEKYIKLEEILTKLSETYEEVLRLRFLGGLSIKEAAIVMGKSEDNIKVLQHRAIEKAKKLLLLNLDV